MATRATLQARIFERRLPEIRFAGPGEPTQALIDRAIAAVKAGDIASARRHAAAAARAFGDEGAEILLLACTELPIALDGAAAPGPEPSTARPGAAPADWLDATDALARACVAASLGRRAVVADPDSPGAPPDR
jgi:aspartate racemase